MGRHKHNNNQKNIKQPGIAELYDRNEVSEFLYYWLDQSMLVGDVMAASNCIETINRFESKTHPMNSQTFNRMCIDMINEMQRLEVESLLSVA